MREHRVDWDKLVQFPAHAHAHEQRKQQRPSRSTLFFAFCHNYPLVLIYLTQWSVHWHGPNCITGDSTENLTKYSERNEDQYATGTYCSISALQPRRLKRRWTNRLESRLTTECSLIVHLKYNLRLVPLKNSPLPFTAGNSKVKLPVEPYNVWQTIP